MTLSGMQNLSVRRVLVYRLGSLGDMLVAVPALRLVRNAFPCAELRLLTNVPVNAKAPAAAAVLDGSGLVDGYMRYEAGTRRLSDLLGLWWSVVRWRPEVVIYLAAARGIQAAKRDARFFKLCHVRRCVGVPLHEGMQANHYGDRPEAERSLDRIRQGLLEPEAARLARNLGELGDARLAFAESWSLNLSAAEHAAAEQAMSEELAGWPVIAVSVGTKVQAKDWGRENWRALLAEMAREFPGFALLLVGAAEEAEASEFAAAGWRAVGNRVMEGPGPVVNLCGRLSPRQSAAALARARLFLGHDSGPMHLAASVGTPCVAIFAARNVPRQWFPFGTEHRVLYHRVECMGCGLETCVEQRRKCLLSISVGEVLAEVRAALQTTSASARSHGSVMIEAR